jgi:hypothetical protein
MSEEQPTFKQKEDILMKSMLRGIIAIAAGEQQAAALFDNMDNRQTVKRMVDYTKKFIVENAENETSNN